MRYSIWYMKPEWFREGICWAKPDPKNLSDTHVRVCETDLMSEPSRAMEGIFQNLNTTYVLPGVRDFPGVVREKGLRHTSMSCGDVLVDEEGKVWLAVSFGFEDITDNKGPMTVAEVVAGWKERS